eukprot:scaffold181800_cov42-Prasinocladus_malaysianus.AAC.1
MRRSSGVSPAPGGHDNFLCDMPGAAEPAPDKRGSCYCGLALTSDTVDGACAIGSHLAPLEKLMACNKTNT